MDKAGLQVEKWTESIAKSI